MHNTVLVSICMTHLFILLTMWAICVSVCLLPWNPCFSHYAFTSYQRMLPWWGIPLGCSAPEHEECVSCIDQPIFWEMLLAFTEHPGASVEYSSRLPPRLCLDLFPVKVLSDTFCNSASTYSKGSDAEADGITESGSTCHLREWLRAVNLTRSREHVQGHVGKSEWTYQLENHLCVSAYGGHC